MTASAKATAAAAAGGGIPSVPAVDFSKFGEIEEVPLSRIRLRAKENLHRSWLNVVHVTQHDVADITELEAFRKANLEEAQKRGFKLTLLAFLMKAAVATLEEYPRVNSSLAPSGSALVYKKYWHLGIAVDTKDGLVVPVIHDVDRKSVYDLAEGARRGERARPRRQAEDGRGARRDASPSPASAASAAPRSRRSSTRPRWRSSACRGRGPRRCGVTGSSCRA